MVLIEKRKKGRWTAEEDKLLMQTIEEEPDPENPNWANIERKFAGKRSTKQIRERWSSHLAPSIEKRQFNDDERKIIDEEFKKNKFKWAKIASKLENATPLMVKNFWNNRLKKRPIIVRHSADSSFAEPSTPVQGFSSGPGLVTLARVASMACSTTSSGANPKKRSKRMSFSFLLNK
ncbi:17044_t:CDS:2 [Dentiscutata erythropus]|uniref:17044_t:CDS:1 n=1 Tax=Dentiscutata erythropus TaxID=1348616 RepID=A0A9N9IHX5_9GLOM|nr:17044_t:CDS:2 [Dentiscutata erythropus]